MTALRTALTALEDLNPQTRIRAAEAIEEMARENPELADVALPVLAEVFSKEPLSDARRAEALAMIAFGPAVGEYAEIVGQFYVSEDVVDHNSLTGKLVELAPHLQGIVPSLIECIRNPECPPDGYWSLVLLNALGPAAAPAIPALISRIGGTWTSNDLFAISLGNFGEVAMPEILSLLDGEHRSSAVIALGCTRSPRAVQPLLDALGKPSDAGPKGWFAEGSGQEYLGQVAAQALGRLGPIAVAARPRLAEWANRDDQWNDVSSIASQARQALEKIDEKTGAERCEISDSSF